METKTKWLFGIGIVAIISLLLWQAFHKDPDLKRAVETLKEATLKMEKSKQSIDSALKQTDALILNNQVFKDYIQQLDGSIKQREMEAAKRESKYLADLKAIKNTIAELKNEFSKTSDSLPKLSVGKLKEDVQ